MTLPKGKKLKTQEIESMKIAVEQADIRAIHPDKMEEFAEYLVQNARKQESKSRKQEPTPWRKGGPLQE